MDKQGIRDIIKKVKGDYFEEENDLVTGGYISSFDILEIIDELEKATGRVIPVESICPMDFNSIDSICKILEKTDA